jgi:hypothetical protein
MGRAMLVRGALVVLAVLSGAACGGGAGPTDAGGEAWCVRQCQNRECGPDGCGGSCGNCAKGRTCSADWICVEATDLPADLAPDAAQDGPANDIQTPDQAADEAATPYDPGPLPEELPDWDAVEIPDVTVDIEEAHDVFVPETTACEPTDLPENWAGTFEGYITSNIPDFGGYTFNGSVDGNAEFTIKCVNERYVVAGKLDGGQTNCALASGCPFTATISGQYDPQTKKIEADLLDGQIDFTAVIVIAEGKMHATLGPGPKFDGTWEGSKKDIVNKLLPGFSFDWVVATGDGTWEASPQ